MLRNGRWNGSNVWTIPTGGHTVWSHFLARAPEIAAKLKEGPEEADEEHHFAGDEQRHAIAQAEDARSRYAAPGVRDLGRITSRHQKNIVVNTVPSTAEDKRPRSFRKCAARIRCRTPSCAPPSASDDRPRAWVDEDDTGALPRN